MSDQNFRSQRFGEDEQPSIRPDSSDPKHDLGGQPLGSPNDAQPGFQAESPQTDAGLSETVTAKESSGSEQVGGSLSSLTPTKNPYPTPAPNWQTPEASDWATTSETSFGSGGGSASQIDNSKGARSFWNRWRGWIIGLFVVAVLTVVGFAIPMPFVISSPGPTYDVLGSIQGEPVIEIGEADAGNEGEPLGDGSTDPDAPDSADVPEIPAVSEGQLRMVTVSSRGGPGSHVSLVEYLIAKLSPRENVRPVEEVYPSDLTREELDEMAMIQMTSSQSTAAAVALEELGYEVGATMTVAGATPGSHAEGLVEEGDVLQAITTPDGVRHEVDRPSVPFALPKTLPPETPVTLELLRNGETVQVDMRTYKPEGAGADFEGSRFGIYLTTDVDLPVDVTIHLEHVGGPSAGLMFALGIIDKFTGGESTGGAIIAGTGAIGFDGTVEPISGIVQKMYGSKRDGAQWFLAPKSNCDEVAGNVPDGLEVWPVGTLSEARDAVNAISAGATVNHPTCEAE